MKNKTLIQLQPPTQLVQKNTNYRNFQPYDPEPNKQQLYPLYTYRLQFKLRYVSQIEKPQFLSWYVSPAYDNTFIIRPRKSKDKKLKHIDSNGQIINELQQQGAYSIHMFTDWQATIWVKQGIKSYKIVQWDLKKNEVINLQWKPSINGTLQFLTFAQTKLIGIIEKSFGTVKISYIQSPLQPNNNQPIFQLHLKKFPNKLRYMGKLNNHSGFGWIKFQQTQQQYIDNLTLYKFDLRQNTQNVQQYIFENPIKKNKIQLQDIWQPQYGVIYLRFRGESISQIDFLTKYQSYQKDKNIIPLLQQQKIIYDIFWDYKNKKYKPIDFISQNQNKKNKKRNRNRNNINNINFDIKMKKQYIVQFSSGYRSKNHITYKDIGQSDHTIKMVGIKTPIIYINAQHYQNIKIKQLQSNQVIDQNILGNYDICCPLFDSYLYMSQNTNYVKNHVVFNIQFKKIMPIIDIKELYAYFIMEITDNCDEDLICYVIQLNSQAVNQMEIKQQNQQIMEQQRQMEQQDQQEQQQEQQQQLDRRVILPRRHRPRNARGRQQDMQQQQN